MLTDVRSSRSPRIDGDDDSTFKSESEGRSSVINLDTTTGILEIIRMQFEESARLREGGEGFISLFVGIWGEGGERTSSVAGISKAGIGIFSIPRPSGRA